jgi:hypothetical protein
MKQQEKNEKGENKKEQQTRHIKDKQSKGDSHIVCEASEQKQVDGLSLGAHATGA